MVIFSETLEDDSNLAQRIDLYSKLTPLNLAHVHANAYTHKHQNITHTMSTMAARQLSQYIH